MLFGTTFDDHPSSLDIPFQSGGFIARMDVVIFGIIVTAYIYLYIYIYIVDRCAKAHVFLRKRSSCVGHNEHVPKNQQHHSYEQNQI